LITLKKLKTHILLKRMLLVTVLFYKQLTLSTYIRNFNQSKNKNKNKNFIYKMLLNNTMIK